MEVSTHMVRVLIWQPDRGVPFRCFSAQQISIDFRSHNFSHILGFRGHMHLFIEESMLWVVVNLSVLDRSDGFTHFIETSRSKIRRAQNILPSTSHD